MRHFGDWLMKHFASFLFDLGEPELIGNPDCPLMYRWTLLDLGWCKLSVHYFLPNTIDVDPHDHPRSFVTFIVAGEYIDIEESGEEPVWELMRRGAVVYRQAQHLHRVHVSAGGAWSIVVMGPLVRSWGFRRGKTWWPWKHYVKTFGGEHSRCEEARLSDEPKTPPIDEGAEGCDRRAYLMSRRYKGTQPPIH